MRILQRELLRNKPYIAYSPPKGYTLIEITAAMGIFLIISAAVVKLFAASAVEFKDNIIGTREDFYVNEAFRYMETEIKDKVKSIDVVNNIIILDKFDPARPERSLIENIKLKGQDVVIEYFENGYKNASNNILTNIESFEAGKVENVLYVGIKFKGNKKVMRCLGASNIKQ